MPYFLLPMPLLSSPRSNPNPNPNPNQVLAVINACKLISLVTRYSCETFGMLIAVIYLYNGAANLIGYFSEKELEPALLSLVLGLGTAWLALLLTG